MTILVTGVTGITGQQVAESLVARGVGVRAVVRDLERGKMATLGMAVELVEGDFDHPKTIEAASKDCHGAFLVTSDGERQVDQEINAAGAMVQSGVQHIVKISSSDTGKRAYSWSVAHARIEEEIVRMDVGYSFLRPHYFMQNFVSLLELDSAGDISLRAPAGDGEIGAIDAYDISECAAALLDTGTPLQSHAVLTGPENIPMSRVAQAFSNATGRHISYVNVDAEEYSRELQKNSQSSVADFISVFEEVRVGTMALLNNSVEQLTGNKPRTIEEFTQANIGAINAAIDSASTG